MQRRKVTFKLDPNAAQLARLAVSARLHCELDSAALEERIDAWRKAGKSISYYAQKDALLQIKADRPEFVDLGGHALQQTLRRLDLALQSFFRRVKAGQTPGLPRFKSAKRVLGLCLSRPGWMDAHATWQERRHAAHRQWGGAMPIRARERHRFGPEAKSNDIALTRRNGQWFVSVTLRVPGAAYAGERTGEQRRGCISASTTGRRSAMEGLFRTRAGCVSSCPSWRRCGARRLSYSIARLRERIANLRRDFMNKGTTRMVW